MLYVVCSTPLIIDVTTELALNLSINPLKNTPNPFMVAPNTQKVSVAPEMKKNVLN